MLLKGENKTPLRNSYISGRLFFAAARFFLFKMFFAALIYICRYDRMYLVE